ncbi:hypothetical protein PI124_g10540, partial [Phytophthora idaei]
MGIQANSLRDTGGDDIEDLEPESRRAASTSEVVLAKEFCRLKRLVR